MAEAILRSKNIPGLEVKSAGVFAMNRSQASPHAQAVLKENQLGINHVSTQLSEQKIDWATLIITMTTGHKEAILSRFKSARDKTFTLSEFAEEASWKEISDPYGGSIDSYRIAFNQMKDMIEKSAKKWQTRD